ncbi:MAG: glycosyltransferase [Deltaproteobacteria bacterium]|nr:glycosyltransferase [Deltaproteobacteria bacterium]
MNSNPLREHSSSADSAEVRKLLQEHHRLSCRVEDLEEALTRLTTSRSWRMTALLRKARLLAKYLSSFLSTRAHVLTFSSVAGASLKNNVWVINTDSAEFNIRSSCGRMPLGWVEFSRSSNQPDVVEDFSLYVDEGEGFSEESCLHVSFRGRRTCLVRLPRLVRGLRLDARSLPHRNVPAEVVAQERYAAVVRGKKLIQLLTQIPLKEYPRLIIDCVGALRSGGWLAFEQQLFGELPHQTDRNKLYAGWVKRYDTLSPAELAAMQAQARALPYKPLLSLLMPVYNNPERWLRAAINSVLEQAYENWELCIVDDASTRPSVRRVLEEYAAQDSRVRVLFRQENGHISRASNSALSMARGEFVVLMDHDDVIPEHALFWVAQELNQYPDAQLIFSDEDRLSQSGERMDAYFKAGLNRELLRSQNLISHMGVYRRDTALRIGGFRPGYEGSQDWDFALRFIEQVPDEQIRHIPKVLYHWRAAPQAVSFSADTKASAFSAAQRCVADHLARLGIEATVTRDEHDDFNRVNYRPMLDLSSIEVVRFSSRIADVQQVLAQSRREFLFFLHENSLPEEEKYLQILLGTLQQTKAGAVGARVWLANQTLKCAGYRPAPQGAAVAVHTGLPRGERGYFGRAASTQEVWAVGLDGMMVRAEALSGVEFTASTQEPDFVALHLCAALRENNQKILWTPLVNVQSAFAVQQDLVEGVPAAALEDAQNSQKLWHSPNLCARSPHYCLAFPPRRP